MRVCLRCRAQRWGFKVWSSGLGLGSTMQGGKENSKRTGNWGYVGFVGIATIIMMFGSWFKYGKALSPKPLTEPLTPGRITNNSP